LDKEDRWDIYIDERLAREKENLCSVNPLAREFAAVLKNEGAGVVLDLGCGLGRHLHYFHELGFRAVGCDISPRTLEMAEEIARSRNVKMEMVQCDFMDLPFNNGVFDGVLAIDAIHHDFLENIFMALREIHRVLCSDGLVCLNPISINDGLFGQGRRLGERLFVLHRIPHYFFDDDEIKYILDRSYFKILHADKDKYVETRDGQEVQREKYRIIARKVCRPRGFYTPMQLPLY
jgi:ubiquinone/menaquinone biosynthesis C-methylase UbiE